MKIARLLLFAALTAIPVLAVACGGDDDDDADNGSATAPATATATEKPSGSITIYSGRGESLVKPLFEQFTKDTGIAVKVKYGDTAELAALIAEEGSKSPADVFFAQDAGALGALKATGAFEELPASITNLVPVTYRADDNSWVGVSGRARVIVYNPDLVTAEKLPNSVRDLTSATWKGKVGWAPTNASFQAFVTGLRQLEGEDGAKAWLEGMVENDVKTYKDNKAIVSAVAAGEIQLGLVNHYYLYGFLKDQGEGFKARNHYTAAGDPGSLVNLAGVGILKSAPNEVAARAFVQYLLGEAAQKYFSEQTFEYPIADGVAADSRLKPLSELQPPDLDLSDLQDLQGTLSLLRSTGVLK
ncbi:MAG: iron ABC transporter substrate-binding protein [Chloroflexi bacterium]|nr:iron ABC transporter substrate-binding protein [Chloroflexota bacterium]PWB69350.1 MAG: iron ABC transporter substrate-binding protein [Holophagae bacterium]